MPRLFEKLCRVTIAAGVGKLRHGIRVEKHRVEFDVEKTLKPEPNTATLKVYNLSKEQRASIGEIRSKKTDKKGIPVLIEAGYVETDASQIFLGDMRTVYSQHDGADWITTLECGDGEKAHATARINVSFGPKTDPATVLNAIVKELGIGRGNVSKAIASLRSKGIARLFEHGVTISGQASYHLTNFCRSADLEWSIQDGSLQFVDKGKTLGKTAIRLSSATGLLESPTVDHKGLLTVKMMMLPDVRPGRLLVIDSLSVRGNYRISKCKWTGDSFDGDWNITAECNKY